VGEGRLQVREVPERGGDGGEPCAGVLAVGRRLHLEHAGTRIARTGPGEHARPVGHQGPDDPRVEHATGPAPQRRHRGVRPAQVVQARGVGRDLGDAGHDGDVVPAQPLRRPAAVPPLADLVEGPLDAGAEAEAPGRCACHLAGPGVVHAAELRPVLGHVAGDPPPVGARHALQQRGHEARRDLGGVGQVDRRRRGGHAAFVAEDRRRLVGEGGAPDVPEEGGVEGVGHLGLGEPDAAGERGGEEAAPHRLLRREAEAEVRRDGEAAEQVGETQPFAHGPSVARPAAPALPARVALAGGRPPPLAGPPLRHGDPQRHPRLPLGG
jgi:hypothetical protein